MTPSSAQYLTNRIARMLIYPNLSSALEIKMIALGQPEVLMLAGLHRLSFNLMANRFENLLCFTWDLSTLSRILGG